jgi:hypothetical protein
MHRAIHPFSQNVFMAWCLVKHRDNSTFTFYLFRLQSKVHVVHQHLFFLVDSKISSKFLGKPPNTMKQSQSIIKQNARKFWTAVPKITHSLSSKYRIFLSSWWLSSKSRNTLLLWNIFVAVRLWFPEAMKILKSRSSGLWHCVGEDGGNTVLRNAGISSHHYTAW